MQGKYAEAVEAYETALAARPGWREAEMNREMARLRAENLKKEGGDMTGGMLAADEIVFTSGKNDSAGQDSPRFHKNLRQWHQEILTRRCDSISGKRTYHCHPPHNLPRDQMDWTHNTIWFEQLPPEDFHNISCRNTKARFCLCKQR